MFKIAIEMVGKLTGNRMVSAAFDALGPVPLPIAVQNLADLASHVVGRILQ